MRKILLITFLLALLVSYSFAQNPIIIRKDTLSDNKLCVEISPLGFFDAPPSYQLGSEIKLKNNLSLYVEGGGYFNVNEVTLNDGGRLSDAKGYIIKCELKYYLNKTHTSNGYYLSLEGFYKKQSFNWQDSIHLTPAYLTTFPDFVSVYCFNAKFGQLIVYKHRIIIDWYVGLGIRFKNITSTLTQQQMSGLKYNNNDNPYNTTEVYWSTYPGGKEIFPNLDLGFKIGYRIL